MGAGGGDMFLCTPEYFYKYKNIFLQSSEFGGTKIPI